MSEETDLLKSAVAHHGSTIVAVGDSYFRYKRAYNSAADSFDKDIPFSVQARRVNALNAAYKSFLWAMAKMVEGKDDLQPSEAGINQGGSESDVN